MERCKKLLASFIVFTITLSVFWTMPVFSTNVSAYSGSTYTSDTTLANKLTNVFNGNVALFANTSARYAVGDVIDKNSRFYIIRNQDWTAGKQCYIYANAVYYYLFGDIPYHGSGQPGYFNNSRVALTNQASASYQSFVNAGVTCGSYLRTTSNSDGSYNGNNGHSLIILSYNASSITFLEGNGDGNGTTLITTKTWSSFNQSLLTNKGRRIAHIVVPRNGATPIPDAAAPTISDIQITNITTSGYTVSCTITDNGSGINRIEFPTWTDYNGQDDLHTPWPQGTANGNRYTFRVNISDHNNELGVYNTHIYAWGNNDKYNSYGIVLVLEAEAPTITDVVVSDVSPSGYTVSCTVNDSGGSGINRVSFPTWTDYNGQDDITQPWPEGTVNGNRYTYRVNTSDHNNELGVYNTHIYAWDNCDNRTSVALTQNVGSTPPTISDVQVTDVSLTGYTVSCTVVANNGGLNRVEFPTWTDYNGQDDLAPSWPQGTVNGNRYTFRVNVSDHNNELGLYNTHIYAWDNYGNRSSIGIAQLLETEPPTVTDISYSDISESGATVSCFVSDGNGSGIQKVEFWVINSEADTFLIYQGVLEGDRYVCRFNTSDYGNQFGDYDVLIIAYDTCGNIGSGEGSVTIGSSGSTTDPIQDPSGVVNMYRLYNPNSGEHFYTSNTGERDYLISLGWNDEGIGWYAPSSSNTPVYRLYNANGGEHHYTTNLSERDYLISIGWNDEGIGWYSDDAETVPLYRQYNPNAFANNHNYTTSLSENDWLVSIGWQAEGIGWYGV